MADLTNVELARPGVWPLASGKTEFTVEHLRDAADFFTATGGQAIPLALGHNDPRFSGDPTFGSVTNVRYTEDDRGPVLLGDLVDMPEWLSAAAPKRWPNRSIEGFQNFEYDGRKYRLVLTALALLGVSPPGVRNIKSLRDLQLALAASAAQRIVATAPTSAAADEPDEPAEPPDDPPQPPDLEAPAPVGASPLPPNDKEAGRMDPAKIREALGLAADASEDDVKAALVTAGLVEASPPPTEPVTATASTEPATEPATKSDTKSDLAHATAAPGTIVLASSVWDETQKTIKSLTSFVEKTKRDERDQVIAKAVSDGKFTPAQKAHFARLWDADPDGTRQLIDNLQKNSALAVMAMGYDGDSDEAIDREYAHLFPPNPSMGGRRG